MADAIAKIPEHSHAFFSLLNLIVKDQQSLYVYHIYSIDVNRGCLQHFYLL